MATPFPKRRRTDAVSRTLAQPFRSPFHPTGHRHGTPGAGRARRDLERELDAARADVDLLRQARTVEAAGGDEAVRAATAKWRVASREAAEVVFDVVKDRVDRMGGLKAWRDSRGRSDRYQELPTDGEDAVPHDHRSSRSENRREWERERERGGPDDEDEVFTMGTMLAILHIDPDVIGYDRQRQQWSGSR
ncbi:MAG: ERAD-associated protein [Piccolia ochrophora]|nr:MAG: ERAD-associated protein [Piccolia ochrophora]